jgi:hypothetical protein
LSASESSLTVSVPSALSGSMKITVTTNGQSAVSTNSFTAL